MYDTKENNCELSTINDSLKEDSPKDDGEHLDYVFEEIGEFSVSQIRKYILICIPIALSAIYAIGFVVTGSSLEYRYVLCVVICPLHAICELDCMCNRKDQLFSYDVVYKEFGNVPNTIVSRQLQ